VEGQDRWPKEWQRLLRSGQAETDEWQRRVREDDNFQADMREVRKRLGLPADNLTIETNQAAWREVATLIAKHQLPSRWHLLLWVELVEGPSGSPWDVSFPESRSYQLPDGGERHELIITPDIDITNRLILNHIVQWQREHVAQPPRPQPMRGDSRKLDWRPVLEWRKRHPSFSHEDIAAMLGYRSDTVRKKLAELESRLDG